MNHLLYHREFAGTFEYSVPDKCYFGKVLGVRSLILYEGNDRAELQTDFEDAVDEYMDDCDEGRLVFEKPACRYLLNDKTRCLDEELRYKDYVGSIYYSEDDKYFFGDVLGMKKVIIYEGRDRAELEANFIKKVDLYVDVCKLTNEIPAVSEDISN